MKTKIPLPHAICIVPCTITRWNKFKGCIDKMTRSLDGMKIPFNKGTPKQLIIICELKKKVVVAGFAQKHCFPNKPIPFKKGYSAIRSHHWNPSNNYMISYMILHPIINHIMQHMTSTCQNLHRKEKMMMSPMILKISTLQREYIKNSMMLMHIFQQICTVEIDTNNFARTSDL